MFNRLRIQAKLLFINAASTVTVLTLVGAFWVYNSYSEYSDFLSSRLKNQALLVSSNITAAILFEDWESAREIMQPLGSDQAIVKAHVENVEAQQLVDIDFIEDADAGLSTGLDAQNFDQFKSIRVAIYDSGQTIGWLVIQYHEQELGAAQTRLTLIVLIMLIFALLLATWMSIRMQSLVTRPIQRLSAVARQVTGSNNYHLRGEYFHPDEIGDLTQNFNAMLDIIEQRDLYLETKAKKRAELLYEKNQELEIHISEREKSEQARRESQARFEQAFFHAPIGMALVDRNHIVFRRNRMFDQVLQTDIQRPIDLHKVIHKDHWEDFRQRFDNLVVDRDIAFERDVVCRTVHGDSLAAVISISPIRNDEGEFRYAVLQLQDVTESRRLSAELEHQAMHDVLTGLANRRALTRALNGILGDESGEQQIHTFCVIDLDHFKIVNDSCGHAAGDLLLQQVAILLRDCVRPDDLAVRLGGDEFGVLLYNCDISKAYEIGETIRLAMEQFEFKWQGIKFRISASIGMTSTTHSNMEIATIMQQADSACFAAKDAGRNRVYAIDHEETQRYRSRGEVRWIQKLTDALDNDQFVLFHQPIFHLQGNEPVHLRSEILLRLHSGQSRLESPGAFLPTVERYGWCDKLDRWVVSSLISSLMRHPELIDNGQRYWVNLSGLSLSNDSFLKYLEDTIGETSLPRGTINFEITETAVIKNLTVATKAMHRLKDLGCQFALDDFGSGITSFGYLKVLPIDFIKIDGVFIRDILSDQVNLLFVKSIIDIADVMGIKTVAEFVESVELRDTLVELGADYAQGFALAHPEPLLPMARSAN